MEAGRFDPKDTTLIQVILEHAPDVKNFGLIINKVSERLATMLQNKDDFLKCWAAQGMQKLPDAMTYVLEMEQMKDQEDQLPSDEVCDQIRQFVTKFSGMVIEPENVKTISGNTFNKKYKETEKIIAELKDNEAQLQKQIKDLILQLEKQQKERGRFTNFIFQYPI